MKPKLLISIILIALLAILAFRFSQKKPATEETIVKKPTMVSAQTVSDSHSFKKTAIYPAIIASNQQITLNASSNGTVTQLNFDLGKNISQGQRLATIDLAGTISSFGENGLKDSQIKGLESAVESADQNYRLAKKVYKKHENYTNKRLKEIAEAQLASAEAALQGALDGKFVSAPISGTITQKFVSVGDSINAGQPIATISKMGKLEVQFFVNKEELSYFKIGDEIKILENDNAISAKISLISPQADESTKRFLVEATPIDNQPLAIGSVVSVEFNMNYLPQSLENLILPLSAITISQNENYIFTINQQKAQKTNIELIKVIGEMAEIKAELNPEDKIIIDGSKLLKEGDELTLKNN
ncbi:MAG: efflux RND transporter periplasmic adaptor subunit [Candidatus Moraniibacteriota bacterium]